jgi:hypothetical protein
LPIECRSRKACVDGLITIGITNVFLYSAPTTENPKYKYLNN